MEYLHKNRGTCSRAVAFEIDDNGILTRAEFIGGCQGNTTGICALVTGMPAAEVVERLRDIDCGGKGTSCPDQLARAIEEVLLEQH